LVGVLSVLVGVGGVPLLVHQAGAGGGFWWVGLVGEVGIDGGLVEVVGGSLFDGDGVLGAVAYAFAEAVAVGVADEFCFAVDDGEGAFGAGGDALAAAVAFFFVDFDDVSGGHVRLVSRYFVF